MFKTIFITFCFLTAISVKSQTDTPVMENVICADLDIKGNIYFIDSSYNICKTTNGVITNRFSLTNYGEGPSIDASNPLEVFVFYENSGIVLILDNQLNPSHQINLYNNNNLKALAFGRSNDGHVWIYDGNTSTLKKFDRSGQVIAESVMLNKAREQNTNGVKKIYDNGSLIAFQTNNKNLLVLNKNIKLVLNKETQLKLVGLEGYGVLQQDKTDLVKTEINNKPKGLNNTIKSNISGEIICAVNGKMLLFKNNKTTIDTY